MKSTAIANFFAALPVFAAADIPIILFTATPRNFP